MYGASFFTDYDEKKQELGSLKDVEAQLASQRETLEKTHEALKKAKQAVATNEASIKEQTDRIDLVKNHWFFGTTALQPQLWLRGGTQGKIARAQAKLDKANADQPKLQGEERELREVTLVRDKAEEQRLVSLGERKVSLQAETAQMRVDAIAANPSEALRGLKATLDTLQLTVNETTEGAEGLKVSGALCTKAVFHYTKAVKKGKEALAAANEAEVVIAAAAAPHALDTFAREPAAEAAEREHMRVAAVADLTATAATLRVTLGEASQAAEALKSLVAGCAKAKAGLDRAAKLTSEAGEADRDSEATMRPASAPEGLHGAAPAPSEDADPTEQRAAALEHLRGQAAILQATIKATSEGAAALKAAALKCKGASDTFDKSQQCVKWAREAEKHANGVMGATPASAGERQEAVGVLKGKLASLKATAKAKASSAESLDASVQALQASHEAYMRAMQRFRVAGNASDEEKDAKLAEARKVAEEATAAMRQGVTALPPLLSSELPANFASVNDLLPAALEGLEDVQACVAVAAEKKERAGALQAKERAAADQALAETPVLEEALKAEEKRVGHLAEARERRAEAADLFHQGLRALPPSFAERYPELSASLVGVEAPPTPFGEFVAASVEADAICAQLHSCSMLCITKEETCKDAEAVLSSECATAKAQLAPIVSAIAAKEKAESKLKQALEEGDKAAETVRAVFDALPASMSAEAETRTPLQRWCKEVAEQYTADAEALLVLDLAVLADHDERQRVGAIGRNAQHAAAKGDAGKALEQTVRKEHATAKAELAKIEAALKAEDTRAAKLNGAVSDGDEGSKLLQRAFAQIHPAIPTRYPQQALSLTSDVHVPLLGDEGGGEVNTRERMAEFFGGSGGGSGCIDEWASADRLRQVRLVVEHCFGLASKQEAAMGELEGRMRQDGEAARAELDTTKEEIKAEETRVFDGLRAAAGK